MSNYFSLNMRDIQKTRSWFALVGIAAVGALLIFVTVERPTSVFALREPRIDHLHGKLADMLKMYEDEKAYYSYKWNYAKSFDDNVKGLKAFWCDNNVNNNSCKTPKGDFSGFALWYRDGLWRALFTNAIDAKYPFQTSGVKQLLTDTYGKLSNKERSDLTKAAAKLKHQPAPTGKIDTHVDHYHSKLGVLLSDYVYLRDTIAYKWDYSKTDAQNADALKAFMCPCSSSDLQGDGFTSFAQWYKAHANEVFFNHGIDGDRQVAVDTIKGWLLNAYESNSNHEYSAYSVAKMEQILLATTH